MKITIDISSLAGKEYSGIPEYTLNLLQGLFKIDKENEYNLFYNSFFKKNINLRIYNAKVDFIKSNYPNKFFNVAQRIFNYPKLNEKTDIFFMPNTGFLSVPKSPKNLITVHDLSFLRFPDFFSLTRRFWHKAINIKKFLKKFDKIVAVSENTKQDIMELLDIQDKKISVIHSGVEVSDLSDINDQEKIKKVRKKYSLPEKYILSLATLEPRKNIETIIEAFDIFLDNNLEKHDFYLLIAGVKGWKNKNIYKAIKKAKYKKQIKFIGYVEKQDKVYLYAFAKLMVYVSYYEGFGFPPLEAMRLNCPVVVAQNSSLQELVGKRTFSVNPFKVSEISSAIEVVLKENAYKDNFKKQAFCIAKSFNWELSARKYLALFDELKKG